MFAFKHRIKWNAYSQHGTSFWLPVWKRRAEKSCPGPPKLSLPRLFYLLLKQMRPIVGNFCAALNASMVTLAEINAFNLLLWCRRHCSAASWEFLGLEAALWWEALCLFAWACWQGFGCAKKELGWAWHFQTSASSSMCLLVASVLSDSFWPHGL